MHLVLKKIQEENKKKRVYAKILNNQMMIVAWKLFKKDRILHTGFMLWKLHREFGFTAWEIANFTGIPTKTIYKYWESIKPFLNTDTLKYYAKLDKEGRLLPKQDSYLQLLAGKHLYNDFPGWYEFNKNHE